VKDPSALLNFCLIDHYLFSCTIGNAVFVVESVVDPQWFQIRILIDLAFYLNGDPNPGSQTN
jgi:hypothetical protein